MKLNQSADLIDGDNKEVTLIDDDIREFDLLV